MGMNSAPKPSPTMATLIFLLLIFVQQSAWGAVRPAATMVTAIWPNHNLLRLGRQREKSKNARLSIWAARSCTQPGLRQFQRSHRNRVLAQGGQADSRARQKDFH